MIRQYLRAMLADRKSSALLYLSWIWGGVSFMMIYFGTDGAYAGTFISGMFAGMSYMYASTKGHKAVINKGNMITP